VFGYYAKQVDFSEFVVKDLLQTLQTTIGTTAVPSFPAYCNGPQ
jgi:hypothetical protein